MCGVPALSFFADCAHNLGITGKLRLQPVRPGGDYRPIYRWPVLLGTVTKVTDGDTIKVELSSGPITVRLSSIDAPESNQRAAMK